MGQITAFDVNGDGVNDFVSRVPTEGAYPICFWYGPFNSAGVHLTWQDADICIQLDGSNSDLFQRPMVPVLSWADYAVLKNGMVDGADALVIGVPFTARSYSVSGDVHILKLPLEYPIKKRSLHTRYPVIHSVWRMTGHGVFSGGKAGFGQVRPDSPMSVYARRSQ
jgi:hypothetical protein